MPRGTGGTGESEVFSCMSKGRENIEADSSVLDIDGKITKNSVSVFVQIPNPNRVYRAYKKNCGTILLLSYINTWGGFCPIAVFCVYKCW